MLVICTDLFYSAPWRAIARQRRLAHNIRLVMHRLAIAMTMGRRDCLGLNLTMVADGIQLFGQLFHLLHVFSGPGLARPQASTLAATAPVLHSGSAAGLTIAAQAHKH